MRLSALTVLCAGVLVLTGCGSLFGAKGLPDESRVISGPKLAVPPDFELRPPRTGDDFATKVSAEKSGEIETLIGGAPVAKPTASAPTDTDSWLVQKVGGTQKTVPVSGEVVSGTVAVPIPLMTSATAK